MESKDIKIIAAGCIAVTTLITIGIGTAIGGAIGMSYAIYGAIMGGMIGYSIDHSLEGLTRGAAIGAIIGIIMERYNKKDHEESGIDNSDYGKAIECASKSIWDNKFDAHKFTNFSDINKGFSEITVCMGANNNDDGSIIIT
jgi:hypothetical protein